MRFISALLTILSLAWIAPAANAVPEPYQAGKHYLELPMPQPVETGDKIELREFFWYGCPHCFALEPSLNTYVKKLPANVRFVRTPGVGSNWMVQAQAYYTFEVLGVIDKVHGDFFKAWHVGNRHMNDMNSIAQFAVEHGVDKAKFIETSNSFGVRMRLEHAKDQNVKFMIDSVPMLVVDGRYLTSPGLAGSEKAAFEVVDFLIKKAASERKTSVPKK